MHVQLSFLGAARTVTGSRYLLETSDLCLLIDCGLYQERELKNRNWQPFPIPPDSIDAILLTHAHIDHSGFIPRLVREGFHGNIYCTTATREISQIALLDSAHLLVEDAEFKRSRHEREKRKGPYPEVPLYTEEDVRVSFPLFAPAEYEKPVQIGDGIEITFHDAGHILGSSIIKVKLKQGLEEKILIFSGDVGRWGKPILRDPSIFPEADYILMESTYGNRIHEGTKEIENTLAEVIKYTKKAGGNIIIPAFAIERSQEILYYLNKLLMEDRIPHLMIFIDSPMAIRVTEVFKHHTELYDEEMTELINRGNSPFDLPSLKMASSVSESKAINHIKGTVIIMAGSGMCTAGRIKHHLANNISRPEGTILFVGYQAYGTLGRQIVDGARDIRIFGNKYPLRARVYQINGFSAHADRDELLKWILSFKKPPRNTFITHGEQEVSLYLADLLKEKTGWNVSVPRYLDTYLLE